MKNLFLSSSFGYDWSRIKNWNKSVKKIGHDSCNILINPNQQLINDCETNEAKVSVWNVQNANKPHNVRFIFQYKYLMSVAHLYERVVLTDSSDVYFNSDPFPMVEDLMKKHDKKIVCGSESIVYMNEHWGNGNLHEGFNYVYDEYKEKEICNVGVLCGETKAVAELCLLIFTMCLHNPASVSDQSSFNILMGTSFFKDTVHMSRPSENLMVHLGTVGIEKFKPWIIEKCDWNSNGLPCIKEQVFPIIHQYNRIPHLNNFIKKLCEG